jgi:hypothetical protein
MWFTGVCSKVDIDYSEIDEGGWFCACNRRSAESTTRESYVSARSAGLLRSQNSVSATCHAFPFILVLTLRQGDLSDLRADESQ